MIQADVVQVKRRWPHLLLLFFGILIPVLAVGYISEDLLEGQQFAFDGPVLQSIHRGATPFLDHLAVWLTTLGGVKVIAPLSAVLLAWLVWKWRAASVFFAVAVAGAAGLNLLLKMVFHRTRPALWPRILNESDASFPSGHAMYSMAFVVALMFLLWPTRWRWTAIVLGTAFTLSVGWSRMYLGLHFPTDVLAGWLSGLAWVLGVWAILHERLRWQSRRAR